MQHTSLRQDSNHFDLDYNDGFNPEIDAVLIDMDGDSIVDGIMEVIHIDGDIHAQIEQIHTELDSDLLAHDTTFEYPDEHHNYDALTSQLDTTSIGQIFGYPTNDEHHWHLQNHQDTCAVVSQEFILNELGESYGIHFTEEQLRQEASAYGYYQDGGGTPLNCVGELLQLHNIPVEKHDGCTLQDLEYKLAEGEKVIVAVNGQEIWNPLDPQVLLHDYFGIPGQNANHAVEVIGVNTNDPNHPIIILNDPGTPNGRGLEVSADRFDRAWETSNHYMVSTTIHQNQTEQAFVLPRDGVMLGSAEDVPYYKDWADYHKKDAENKQDWAQYHEHNAVWNAENNNPEKAKSDIESAEYQHKQAEEAAQKAAEAEKKAKEAAEGW
jgi:hypothetical protein